MVALVRELHAANPQMKQYTLAVEARKKALCEFDEKDLPSVQTIVRHLKSIPRVQGLAGPGKALTALAGI